MTTMKATGSHLTFGPACLISADFAAVIARDPALDAAGIDRDLLYFRSAGSWTYMPAPGVGCNLAYDRTRRELLVVTGDGLVQIVGAQGTHSELIDRSAEGPSNLQWILGVTQIGNAMYAYGMSRQVYRRLAGSGWERVDAGIRSNDVAGIKSMCGLDENEIYAVGFKGEIWTRHAGRWSPIDSPTNVKLEQVCATSSGNFIACGGAGTVLQGRGTRWAPVPQTKVTDTIWSVAEFKGTTYMSTTTRLLRLQGDELEDVAGLPSDANTFSFLAASPNALWSIGHSDLLEFDGTRWSRIAPPASTPSSEAEA